MVDNCSREVIRNFFFEEIITIRTVRKGGAKKYKNFFITNFAKFRFIIKSIVLEKNSKLFINFRFKK